MAKLAVLHSYMQKRKIEVTVFLHPSKYVSLILKDKLYNGDENWNLSTQKNPLKQTYKQSHCEPD